jgi:hypothetical protein
MPLSMCRFRFGTGRGTGHREQLPMAGFHQGGRFLLQIDLPALQLGPGRTWLRTAVPLDAEGDGGRLPHELLHPAR